MKVVSSAGLSTVTYPKQFRSLLQPEHLMYTLSIYTEHEDSCILFLRSYVEIFRSR